VLQVRPEWKIHVLINSLKVKEKESDACLRESGDIGYVFNGERGLLLSDSIIVQTMGDLLQL